MALHKVYLLRIKLTTAIGSSYNHFFGGTHTHLQLLHYNIIAIKLYDCYSQYYRTSSRVSRQEFVSVSYNANKILMSTRISINRYKINNIVYSNKSAYIYSKINMTTTTKQDQNLLASICEQAYFNYKSSSSSGRKFSCQFSKRNKVITVISDSERLSYLVS